MRPKHRVGQQRALCGHADIFWREHLATTPCPGNELRLDDAYAVMQICTECISVNWPRTVADGALVAVMYALPALPFSGFLREGAAEFSAKFTGPCT